MALVCRIVIDWIEKEVTEPVDKWVDELQENCHQYPWYDPRGLFCWFIVVSVKVIAYITKNVTIQISQTVCFLMAALLHFSLSPIALAIDEITQTTKIYIKIKTWLRTCSNVTLKEKQQTGKKGIFNYVYSCECCNRSDDTTSEISFLGDDDNAAFKYARKECAKKCTEP